MTTTVAEQHQLVEECQGLVRFLAQQARSRLPAWIELDDLISYGQVGLLQAARDFDSSRGTKFSTFAYYRIRGSLFDGINKLMWFRSVRHPETKFNQMADSLIQTSMEETSTASSEVADELAHEASWFSRMASSLAVMYLASTDADGHSTDVEDKSIDAPWSGIVETETHDQLVEALDKLPADAAALVRAIYYEDRTLQEAADRLGISKSWASRMHARALEQLGRSMKKTASDNDPD